MNAAVDATGQQAPASTLSTLVSLQSDDYNGAFQAKEPKDGGKLLDDLSEMFSRYQITIGLSSKLVVLKGYALHFKIDDSSSMSSKCANGMSRWKNGEQRLHTLIDLLQFVPTRSITFSFLDRRDTFTLDRLGKIFN